MSRDLSDDETKALHRWIPRRLKEFGGERVTALETSAFIDGWRSRSRIKKPKDTPGLNFLRCCKCGHHTRKVACPKCEHMLCCGCQAPDPSFRKRRTTAKYPS